MRAEQPSALMLQIKASEFKLVQVGFASSTIHVALTAHHSISMVPTQAPYYVLRLVVVVG